MVGTQGVGRLGGRRDALTDEYKNEDPDTLSNGGMGSHSSQMAFQLEDPFLAGEYQLILDGHRWTLQSIGSVFKSADAVTAVLSDPARAVFDGEVFKMLLTFRKTRMDVLLRLGGKLI